jgi:hypothetical protein
MTALDDSVILIQLLNGYHLEPEELKRAEQIVHSIKVELKSRTRKETK